MASSLDFVEYICEQLSGAGEITYKKMFGEYGIYCNEKIVGVICDNQFFVKKTEAGAAVYPNCEEAAPYTTAQAQFVIDSVDDRNLMAKFISATYNELPIPKPKRKKKQAASTEK